MSTQSTPQLTVFDWLCQPASSASAPSPLSWHPGQIEDCLQARAAHLPPPLAPAELAELRAAHARWGADQAALDNLERLASPSARVIVTGQQAGLLAGPLLVIYKTLTAVKLAAQLAAQRPDLHFVPVFWLAGEDHDFAEVRRACWPGPGGALDEAALAPQEWLWGQMTGMIPTAPLHDRLAAQCAALPPTEFSPAVLECLSAAYGGASTLEDGFARLLLRLLRGTGLVIVSPRMAWLRQRALPLLAAEFAAPGLSSATVNGRGEALAPLFSGEPALVRAPGALNAFWLDPQGRRHTLRMAGDGRVARALPRGNPAGGPPESAAPAPFSLEALRGELQAAPDHFSPNVVTRPMLQDSALPTVAQVVGPGEAAYLAMVESVYPAFGVFAPLRWPRAQALLLEPRVLRQMEKHGVALREALALSPAALQEQAAARALQGSGELAALEQLAARQLAEVEALRASSSAAAVAAGKKPDPAIDGAFQKLAQSMDKGFSTIRDRLVRQREQEQGSLRGALDAIANSVRPGGADQERALNPMLPFAWNYGLDWPARLAARLSVEPSAGLQIFKLADL